MTDGSASKRFARCKRGRAEGRWLRTEHRAATAGTLPAGEPCTTAVLLRACLLPIFRRAFKSACFDSRSNRVALGTRKAITTAIWCTDVFITDFQTAVRDAQAKDLQAWADGSWLRTEHRPANPVLFPSAVLVLPNFPPCFQIGLL
jgi:hypothetical protein